MNSDNNLLLPKHGKMSVSIRSSTIEKKLKNQLFDNDSTSNYDEFSIMTQITENGTQTRLSPSKDETIFSETKPEKCLHKPSIRTKHIIARQTPKKRTIKIMDWKRFHRLNILYAFLDDLERDYPAICTVSVIGKSVEGRDIKMLKVSNSDASNTSVWLDGGIHAREWISPAVVTYIADNLVKTFHDQPDYITNKDWHFVPVLNPDGYEFSHTKDRMWRKNKAVSKCGTFVGVDLNRNFSYGWGNNGDEGSSDEPLNVFYRGPAPFSEPETAAVRDTILGANTKFEVFLSYHSYFEVIIFPWGYKTDPCPDYLNLLEGGIAIARAIYNTSGRIYKVGSTKDLTYFACGTATDWSYGIAKIPFSYMVELGTRKHKFKHPRDQIPITCEENWQGVLSLMEYVNEKNLLN